ncbi:hypothetical protein HPB47_024786, partial [Ixodes persulcatus]
GVTESENDETADAVLNSYEENVTDDGERYQVSLLWRPSVLLHSNKDVAEKRPLGSSQKKNAHCGGLYGHGDALVFVARLPTQFNEDARCKASKSRLLPKQKSAAGVIYEVPADLTEVELQLAVRTTAPVISIRRLGKSETVKLVFSTDTLPEELRCGRCGGPHDRTKCEAEDPLCMNCNKAHDSTSRLCPAFKREQKIYRYKSEAKVGYTSAKEALRSTQDQMSTGHARTAANQARHDVAAHDL